MSQPILVVDDVTKTYGPINALDGVSLRVRPGEFVALLGPNGAGKSTLLQLLTGLFTADSGHIGVMGEDMRRNATRALADIGVVFQQQTLDLDLSIQANFAFHADLHGIGRKQRRERIARALDSYGLTDRASGRVRTLSGGNRRRVELARALLHEPRLLLMDEATVGLDPGSRKMLLEDMVRLKTEQDMGILWATHLVDEVEYADRVVVLKKGKVLFEGTPEAVLRQHGVASLNDVLSRMVGDSEEFPLSG